MCWIDVVLFADSNDPFTWILSLCSALEIYSLDVNPSFKEWELWWWEVSVFKSLTYGSVILSKFISKFEICGVCGSVVEIVLQRLNRFSSHKSHSMLIIYNISSLDGHLGLKKKFGVRSFRSLRSLFLSRA